MGLVECVFHLGRFFARFRGGCAGIGFEIFPVLIQFLLQLLQLAPIRIQYVLCGIGRVLCANSVQLGGGIAVFTCGRL